jgi:sugar phosphate isomerase/epimerase
MNFTRRRFIQSAALQAGALALLRSPASAAQPAPKSYVTGTSGMKLGTVTYNLGKDWDIPTLIKTCTATGFEGVEARTTHRHGVELSLNAQQRAEVKRQFADSPVKLYGLGSIYDYHTPDQEKLKRDIAETKRYLELSRDVGSTGVKVRPNGLPPGVPVEKTLEQIGRALREVGTYARELGQEIRLEVHGTGTALLPNIKKIMDVADHPAVGVCWNSNPTDLEGAGFDANFDLVKNKIVEVHLRDLYVEDYPFRRLFTRLKEVGYRGFCLAEIDATNDPVRVMKYFRSQWLSYQGLL